MFLNIHFNDNRCAINFNIFCMQLDYYLDLYTAILGEEITISDFDDAILQLRVAAGTQMGIKIILKGKGFPVYKKEGQFGNLYINY